MKLLLCPGRTKRFGWYSLDGDPESGADWIATIPPLPAEVTQKKWEEVEWIHGPASLYPWELDEVLVSIRLMLEPDGRLIMETPDITKAARMMMANPSHTYMVFGDPQHLSPAYMNHWGYTPDSLKAAVLKAGFTTVKILPALFHLPVRDFRMEVRP